MTTAATPRTPAPDPKAWWSLLTEAARPSGLAVAELPVQLSSFVARERELLKPGSLTLTRPESGGKTRAGPGAGRFDACAVYQPESVLSGTSSYVRGRGEVNL